MAASNGGSVDTNQEQILALTTKINTNNTDLASILNTINNLPEVGTTPSGELAITSNGTYDVTNYASANVNVASSGGSGGGIETINIDFMVGGWHMDGAPDYRIFVNVYKNNEFSIEEYSLLDMMLIENVVVGSTLVVIENNKNYKPSIGIYNEETGEFAEELKTYNGTHYMTMATIPAYATYIDIANDAS